VQIAALKGIAAGSTNVLLAVQQAPWPAPSAILGAGVVGFLGYGTSLVLFVLALRLLGTARTGAYFSTAPFMGAIAGAVAFHEPLTWQAFLAGGLMGAGVWLHLTERHEHEHQHEALEHTHAHVHDEHPSTPTRRELRSGSRIAMPTCTRRSVTATRTSRICTIGIITDGSRPSPASVGGVTNGSQFV
jgi:hypothetical protein